MADLKDRLTSFRSSTAGLVLMLAVGFVMFAPELFKDFPAVVAVANYLNQIGFGVAAVVGIGALGLFSKDK